MKNYTNPIQETIEVYDFSIEPKIKKSFSLSLSPNEFSNKDDSFGFL